MEVALDRCYIYHATIIATVSILVFMEVALDQRIIVSYCDSIIRFNPCFHGSSSRSPSAISFAQQDTCFNPCFHGSSSRSPTARHHRHAESRVSILVFMEVALDHLATTLGIVPGIGFNPCFHGSSSRSLATTLGIVPGIGFNPCFHGSSSRSVHCKS